LGKAFGPHKKTHYKNGETNSQEAGNPLNSRGINRNVDENINNMNNGAVLGVSNGIGNNIVNNNIIINGGNVKTEKE
jgi:hypothetical protein